MREIKTSPSNNPPRDLSISSCFYHIIVMIYHSGAAYTAIKRLAEIHKLFGQIMTENVGTHSISNIDYSI